METAENLCLGFCCREKGFLQRSRPFCVLSAVAHYQRRSIFRLYTSEVRMDAPSAPKTTANEMVTGMGIQ